MLFYSLEVPKADLHGQRLCGVGTSGSFKGSATRRLTSPIADGRALGTESHT